MKGHPIQSFNRDVYAFIRRLDILVKKGKVPADHYEIIKKELLIPIVDLADSVKESDLVIEAIHGNYGTKKET
ncbi:MAG: hypothetical protein GY760_03525 [Deltaproteobacteria bacterium]|nr:hypothetical protein [Deltaproteobacteria bacterium]